MSAAVMGVTKDLGIIAAGKLADMVLIDGDPAKNIRDTRNITTVIKAGKSMIQLPLRKRWGSPRVRHASSTHLSLPPSYFIILTFH